MLKQCALLKVKVSMLVKILVKLVALESILSIYTVVFPMRAVGQAKKALLQLNLPKHDRVSKMHVYQEFLPCKETVRLLGSTVPSLIVPGIVLIRDTFFLNEQ